MAVRLHSSAINRLLALTACIWINMALYWKLAVFSSTPAPCHYLTPLLNGLFNNA